MFTRPTKNLNELGLIPGMEVVDLGAGNGEYSLEASRLVVGGHVYAIEIIKDLVPRLQNLAKDSRRLNISVVWGDIEVPGGTRLRDGSADRVIASNILFQVTDRKGFVEEIKRIIKPKGKVMLIDWGLLSKPRTVGHVSETLGVDWSDVTNKIGPRKDMLVSEQTAIELFTDAGFTLEKKFNAGDHHYGLIFSIDK